jgi:hypothetical protein
VGAAIVVIGLVGAGLLGGQVTAPGPTPSAGGLSQASDASGAAPNPLAARTAVAGPGRRPLLPDAANPPREDIATCPGATRLIDIVDTSVEDNTSAHWVNGFFGQSDPGVEVRSQRLAIAIPRDFRVDVELVDPSSNRACLLAELPNVGVGSMRWSPNLDALAIVASGGESDLRGVYIWSTAGITRAIALPGDASVSWSPEGSTLGIASATDGDVWLLFPGGLPPQQVGCARRSGGRGKCSPSLAAGLFWSPDGAELATAFNDVNGPDVTTVLYHAALTVDGVLRPVDLGPYKGTVVPVAWLADRTLAAADRAHGKLVWVLLNDKVEVVPKRDLPVSGWVGSISPDGEAAMTWPNGGELFAIDPETGTLTGPLNPRPPDGLVDPHDSWTRDGQWYAFQLVDEFAHHLGVEAIIPDGSQLHEIAGEGSVLAGLSDQVNDFPAVYGQYLPDDT